MAVPFTALGYYKVSPDLAGHPKIVDLAKQLGIERPTALGIWHGVMSYASKYMPEDGNLSRVPSARIAEACEWQGDSDLLLKVLVRVGLVDDCVLSVTESVLRSDTEVSTENRIVRIIHGWDDWYSDVSEFREASTKKSDGAKLGNHNRHHAQKGMKKADCEYCLSTESVPRSVTDSHTDLHIVEESREQKRRGLKTTLPTSRETSIEEVDDEI